MSNKSINLDFENERKMIIDELKINDEFYNETKIHFNQVKNSHGQGSLSFVHLQTSNLVNMRNNRLALIKELVNIKKNSADIKLKEMNINKESGIVDQDLKNIASEMINIISNNRKDFAYNSLSINNENDEEIDRLLEERLTEDKEEDTINYIIVSDMEKKLYAVDSDYNIIPDIKTPDDWIIRFEGSGEDISAFNQYDKELDIIVFD